MNFEAPIVGGSASVVGPLQDEVAESFLTLVVFSIAAAVAYPLLVLMAQRVGWGGHSFATAAILLRLATTSSFIRTQERRRVDDGEKLSVAVECPRGHGVTHLAVIMDGNRRYGRAVCGASDAASSLAAARGHREGGETLLRFLRDCIDAEIRVVTCYAFSTENWGRPAEEVALLMDIFREYVNRIRRFAAETSSTIRFVATDAAKLPSDIVAQMEGIERQSARESPTLIVNVCVSYGARQELSRAVHRVASRMIKSSSSSTGDPPTVDDVEKALRAELMLSLTDDSQKCEKQRSAWWGLASSDPQLLIRTSGECRVSNFMLFHLAYTELMFVPLPWPQFSKQVLWGALEDYARRQRRFGR